MALARADEATCSFSSSATTTTTVGLARTGASRVSGSEDESEDASRVDVGEDESADASRVGVGEDESAENTGLGVGGLRWKIAFFTHT